MKKFAFLVHPRRSMKDDMRKVWKPLGWFPERLLCSVIKNFPPLAPKTGEVYLTDHPEEVAGWIMVVPLTGPQMLLLPKSFVKQKILATIKKAQKMGAEIVGLGALTSPVTNGGICLLGEVEVAITNGNSFTAGITVQAVESIASKMGLDLATATVAIVGATGSVGTATSLLFSEKGVPLLLLARNESNLRNLAKQIPNVAFSTNLTDLKQAEIVVVVTSATEAIIRPEHLRIGAVVYDDTQPRNTSRMLTETRPDVTVIDGGVIATPGIDFRLNIGLRRNQVYACLAETILLAIEEYSGHYSIGNATVEQAKETMRLAQKHRKYGFQLAPFHSFGRPLDDFIPRQIPVAP